MTPAEAEQAVRDGATVSLHSAHDHSEYAVGKAISYSLVPTITIELSPGGSHISWRHDLAEVVEPPKPAEPTGLGAVVEDAAGCLWVRIWNSAVGGKTWTQGIKNERAWTDVNAVRVLSEGVAR